MVLSVVIRDEQSGKGVAFRGVSPALLLESTRIAMQQLARRA